MEDDDLPVRVREFCPDAEWQADSHSAEWPRVEAMPRNVGRNRLTRVVQNLVSIDDQDRVTLHEVPYLLA